MGGVKENQKMAGLNIEKNKKTIKFCFLHKAQNFEMTQGIAILRSVLLKEGYNVKEFSSFYKDFNSFFRKILLTNRYGTRVLDKLDYKYLKGGNDSYPFKNKLDKLIDMMDVNDSDIIGFSLFSYYQFVPSLILAKRIKQRFNVPIIFGGAYIRFSHDIIDLKKYDFIDFLVYANAESALPELIRNLGKERKDLKNVPGIKYVSKNRLVINKSITSDINEIPPPTYKMKSLKAIFKKKEYNPIFGLLYEATKGCPFKCNFCSRAIINQYSQKRINKVISDLKKLQRQTGCNQFRFVDSNMGADISYLERLCKAMIKENLRIKWIASTTPLLKYDLLKLMKKAGCQNLIFGLESGSQRINNLMGKPIKLAGIEQFFRDSFRAGIKNTVSFMIGFPTEKKEDFQQTINFLLRNRKYIYYVFPYKFMLIYGCSVFQNPEKFKIKITGNISNSYPIYYKFDEINGKTWKTREEQFKKDLKWMLKQFEKYKINYAKGWDVI